MSNNESQCTRMLSLLLAGGSLFASACSTATDAKAPSGAQTMGAASSAGVGAPATAAAAGNAGRVAAGSGNAGRPAASATSATASAGTPSSRSAANGGMSAAGVTGVPSGGAEAGSSGTATAAAGTHAAGAGGMPAAMDMGAFVENTGSDCGSSAGALKKNDKLPDPFGMHDGTRVSTRAAWRCRRNEIKQDLEKYEIGPKPDKPTVEASVSGSKLDVKVTTSAGSITLSSTVTAASGSRCVAIGMNVKSSLVSGCVQVPFMHDQVVKYGQDNSRSQSDPFYKVYPELWNKVGNYAAWSWGISRLIDGLVQVKDELQIDPTKIAVHGCSYAGKMALFAGAFDERIALTIAQESGGGGINAWRTSQDFTKRTGTNIEKIDNTSGSWFLPSMKQLDPYSLPHDHHELIAMIAPRAIVAMGNQDYEWLGDESGWKSINAAKEVWKALGAEDHIGFDFTSNHTHCSAPASQVASAKAFVDRFLKGQSANTAIAIAPQEGNFDLDFKTAIDWQTPTLQ